MKPENPRWDEFVERLEGPKGCDFKEKEPGNPESTTWKCKGGKNKDFARAILQTMPEIDVEASLRYFESKGGHCDCEILFNVG